MSRRISQKVAAALAGAAVTLCLTGCTPPFAITATAPTIAPTLLPAAPSIVRPPLVPSGPSPVLVSTGTNWAPMLASMLTYGQWLLANPGLGVTATLAAPGCPLTDLLTSQTTGFSTSGWRLAPAPLTISWLGAPSALAPGQTVVHLQVDASRGAETVLDANGQPASAVAALPPPAFDVSLSLGGDGRWRLCTAEPLGPVQTTSGAVQSNPSLL
jgi:hypothetical protein